MSRQAHAAAVLTRLGAAPGSPALVVSDGSVADGTVPPYVVVYFGFRFLTASDAPAVTALNFDSTAMQVELTLHSVGANGQAARAVANRAGTQLLNWRPTVAGRSCTPLRQVDSVPARSDESTGVLAVDLVDVYRFVSVPS